MLRLLLLAYLLMLVLVAVVLRPESQFVRIGEWCTQNEHYPQGVCLGIFEWR